MTGVGVRIAGKNRFVTHIPNGGTLAAYNDIIPSLAEIDSHNSQSFDKQLKNICLFIPKLLEEKFEGYKNYQLKTKKIIPFIF